MTDRQRAMAAFRAAWRGRYGQDPILGNPEAKAVMDALEAWRSVGGALDDFCSGAVPAYVADEDPFLGKARHHPRHLRGQLDRYRVQVTISVGSPAGGHDGRAVCCGAALDDGAPTRRTDRGVEHVRCPARAGRGVR